MVNRAELLSLVERARAELPAELDEAAALLVAHQDVIATAERASEKVLARAHADAEQLVEESVLVATARARSEQILDAARSEAARLLREADDYCDRRLAVFENDLERAMAQVRRGRDRLRERSDLQPADQVQPNGAEVPGQARFTESSERATSTKPGVTDDLAAATAGRESPRERLILDLAAMERAAVDRSGLGQRVKLQ
jgi:cell division septum initiation protein DivIVA